MCSRNILEPSHIFASLKPLNYQERDSVPALPKHHKREVQVSGSTEFHVSPQISILTIVVTSKKDNSADAKNSVIRRLSYIEQTLKNHGIQDADIIIVKNLSRVPNKNLYHMEAQIDATFHSNVHKCLSLHNLFVEKLDDTVTVLQPQLIQDGQKIQAVKRQACLAALANARQKAMEVCRMLGQTLGRPMSVKEETCQVEQDNQCDPTITDITKHPIDIQQRLKALTLTVHVDVTATFELKAKKEKSGK